MPFSPRKINLFLDILLIIPIPSKINTKSNTFFASEMKLYTPSIIYCEKGYFVGKLAINKFAVASVELTHFCE